MGTFEIQVSVLENTPWGAIHEIALTGKHEEGDGCEIADLLHRMLHKHKPEAVIFDMLRYRYGGGNDIGGVLQIFAYPTSAAPHPACILAGKVTKQSLEFLTRGVFAEAFGVKYFSDTATALDYLRGRLRERTA